MTVTLTAPASTATDLPPCPIWCAGDHIGGRVEKLPDGSTITTDRIHEHTLTALDVVDSDSYRGSRTVDLRVYIERLDSLDPDEPHVETRVVLEVDGRQRLAPTSAQLRELAASALEAAALLDAATVPALAVAA